eukprot:3478707-Rhodomonas_salina.3
MFSCVSADLLRIVDAGEDERSFPSSNTPSDLPHVRRLLEAMNNARGPEETEKGALHAAAKSGNLEELNALLEKGADVNDADDFGRTPLMDAAWEGNAEAVKFLLDHGADSEIENHGGGTALKVAMRKRHPEGSEQQRGGDEVVRILREHRQTHRRNGEEDSLYRDYKWHRDPDWKWPNQRAGATEQADQAEF